MDIFTNMLPGLPCAPRPIQPSRLLCTYCLGRKVLSPPCHAPCIVRSKQSRSLSGFALSFENIHWKRRRHLARSSTEEKEVQSAVKDSDRPLEKAEQGLSPGAVALWLLYAGPPIWRIQAADLKDVINESINFWYVNIGLEAAGLPYVPAEASHPVSEALFNFVNTWTFILLPLMVHDGRGRKRIPLWIGAMFATNVFMVPYFALRISPGGHPSNMPAPKSPIPGIKWSQFTPYFAWPAILITAISAYWLVAARPELGGSLAERWDYFLQAARSDRAFAAFLSDMVLYSIWQYVLMKDAPGLYRRLPYFGILAWYLDFWRPALEQSPVRSKGR